MPLQPPSHGSIVQQGWGEGQFCGSGSGRIPNVLRDSDPHSEPAILDPDPFLDAAFLTLKIYKFFAIHALKWSNSYTFSYKSLKMLQKSCGRLIMYT